jgi:DNA-directed RNA polymerase subunit RPC12/RpoP
MMQIWYSWKGGREEKTLRVVTQKQRAKVEEIKKKTNYDSTRSLLEKYADPGTPIRRLQPLPQPRTPLPTAPQAHLQTPVVQQRNLPLQLSPTPQPIQPTRKQWYDKLADAILGDEESSMSVAASRYALICQKCFSHNGLVKESVWEDTQYVCPKCGFLNPSARSKRLGLQRTPSPPVNVNTDPTASPQPASMEGVESTAPSVDMVPEKGER